MSRKRRSRSPVSHRAGFRLGEHSSSERRPYGPGRKRRSTAPLIKGRLRAYRRGLGIAPLGGGRVLRARGWARSGAREGDLVLAEASGNVVKVLHEGDRTALGTVQGGRDVRLQGTSRRVRASERRGLKLAPGTRVLLALPDRSRSAYEIKEVLGLEGELDVEVEAALRSRGFHRRFPSEVEEEADRVVSRSSRNGCSDRLDLRSLLVLTVDPDDAQDFDDALSLEPLRGGGLRLGVHIADVSHYVRTEGALDHEAFRRAFSVYPAGGVVPMLPERLSADECSLVEGQARRSFSVFLDFDSTHQLRSADMALSLVQSRARLTYGEAQELMDDSHRREEVGGVLRRMRPLMHALRERRTARGGLDLDSGETEITLGRDGRPQRISWARHLESHDLVEEFMIAANCAVADRLCQLVWPAVYRVHPKPTLESLARLADWLAPLGYQLRDPKRVGPADLQRLLEQVRGTRHGRLVSYLVLRSLSKALYSATNQGHYGLALERYLHFTSPIRRYPDLVVHRFLKRALAGTPPGSLPEERRLSEVADVCSYREEMAVGAEREVEAVYVTAYMRSRLGETFSGMVVGVEPFGVFVELEEMPVHGMIPAEEFGGRRHLRKRTAELSLGGRAVEPGRMLTVRVVRADVGRRQVEFSLT